MRKVFFAVVFLIPLASDAQAPGGVSPNLKLWLKANRGITVDPSNNVALWKEMSGANITGDFATQGSNINMIAVQNPPAYVAAGINFNPQVSFSQSITNSVSSNNAFVGTQLIDPYNNTMLQVINLHTISGTGVWFKWQYSNTNVNRWGNEVNNGGTNAGKLRFDFRGINNFSTTIINDQYVLAACNTTQAQSIIRLNGTNDAVVSYTTQAAFAPLAGSPARLTIGNEEYGDEYPTTVDVAEMILYNRALTAAERNKVESYLAVKYGFTLDQSAIGANNYTSSIGTVIWDRVANMPFVNNITGIGRDDADSLVQRQSRSINTAGLVTIYNGSYNGSNFPTLNTANINGFQADNSYLLFGDNGGTTALNRCVSGNPSFLRMNRVWKAQVTGAIGTVTLAVNASSVPGNTMHLLVSTDSLFSPTNTTAYRLDAFSGVLSKSVVLPNNSFFTFASDSLVLRPGSNSPLCVGSTIQLTANAPGNATFSWTGPNNFSSTLANPSIPAAGLMNAGVYVLNATSNGCAFLPGSVTVNVSAMPAPPVVITPLYYCVGDTAAQLTATGQGLTWYRVPIGGFGNVATTGPTPSTVVEDTLRWWVTQSNNGCESIRTKQEVVVRARPNGIIAGLKTTICQGDIDSFYYYGNGSATMDYNWKGPVGLTSMLSGSGQGPVVFRFDSSGVINVRLQLNNGGCVSHEMFFPVTINPRPIAHPVIRRNACINDVVDVALDGLSPGITHYSWDFGGGEVHYAAPPAGPYGITWPDAGDKLVSLVTFSEGCPSYRLTDTVTVHGPPLARIAAIGNGKICMGDTILMQAQVADEANTFVWGPRVYFTDSIGPSAWSTIQRSDYVHVLVTSPWGCKASDSVLVDAQPCCQVVLPTAFTPNGDGRNDRFGIVTRGHHEVHNFRIVNRWGQVVFETHDERVGWDGTFNGQKQDLGTYYYYLKFRCAEGKGRDMEQKGEFTLIR